MYVAKDSEVYRPDGSMLCITIGPNTAVKVANELNQLRTELDKAQACALSGVTTMKVKDKETGDIYEAIQWTGDNAEAIDDWVNRHGHARISFHFRYDTSGSIISNETYIFIEYDESEEGAECGEECNLGEWIVFMSQYQEYWTGSLDELKDEFSVMYVLNGV